MDGKCADKCKNRILIDLAKEVYNTIIMQGEDGCWYRYMDGIGVKIEEEKIDHAIQ